MYAFVLLRWFLVRLKAINKISDIELRALIMLVLGLRRYFLFSLFSILSFMSVHVCAVDLKAIQAMQKAKVDRQDVYLNGIGEVKYLGHSIYIATLYLQEKSSIDEDIIASHSNKRIEMRFYADEFFAKRFARNLATSIKMNNKTEDWSLQRGNVQRLLAVFKGVFKKGDVLQFDFAHEKWVKVRLNKKELITLRNTSFAPVLLKAWFGDKSSNPEFKKGLRGKNPKKAKELSERYLTL